MNGVPLLSVTLLLPLFGAIVVAMLPRDAHQTIRRTGLAWSIASFAASVAVLATFEPGRASFQLVERIPWLPAFGADYHLGVDGISLFLVLLTTFLFPLSFLVSWNVSERVKQFAIVLLLTETAIVGVFLALDLLLFYVFWEAMLIPMYLLIGIWGYERRIYATIKFFIYTLLGGLLMLVGIVFLHVSSGASVGGRTFAYGELAEVAGALPLGTQRWLFAAFFVAFAVKVPIWPLHTWLPDAHTEAPTAGSVILAGVLLKMGTYGLLRFLLPYFPEVAAEAAPLVMVLAVVGILYGAAVSVVQNDLKRLVAYSSVSHLGFVVLGIFAFTLQGAQGATLQMVNHGLSTGALFMLVGMLYERRHTRLIADYGGIDAAVPKLSGAFLLVSLASLGLPGLNGFVGEFLILLGTFSVNRLAAVLATAGVVLGALYLLWAVQRTFHGPIVHDDNRVLKDLSVRERLVLYPVIAVIIAIGVWPQPLLSRMEPSVQKAVAAVVGGPAPLEDLVPTPPRAGAAESHGGR